VACSTSIGSDADVDADADSSSPKRSTTTTTSTTTTSTATSASPVVSISESFHDDMRRVLESRKQNGMLSIHTAATSSTATGTATATTAPTDAAAATSSIHTRTKTDNTSSSNSNSNSSSSSSSSSRRDRKHKPVILESDVDGAERAHAMLQHLRGIGAASEVSYQIVMRAFLQRGRLRWHSTSSSSSSSSSSSTAAPPATTTTNNNNHNNHHNNNNNESGSGSGTIVCAADQLEHLLQELVQMNLDTAKIGQDEDEDTDNDGADIDINIDIDIDNDININNDTVLPVSMETYNMVLEAYATCSTPRGDRDYANRAHQLLQRMRAMFGQDTDVDVDVDADTDVNVNAGGGVPVESLMHVLHAYAWQQANLQDGLCAEAADQLLVEIAGRTSDPAILLPCYDWTLEAWSKSGSVNSAQQADIMFAKIKALNETLTTDCDEATLSLFDAETYSNAILAWSKCSEAGSAEQAHQLLLDMLNRYQAGAFPVGSEPTLIAFNGVITAWGKTGRVDKAEEVLWLMEEFRPECQELVPDAVSYNSVLHAYTLRNPNKKQALEKALHLVQYMENNYQTQPSIKPNTFTYKTLMKCWIQSGEPNVAESVEKVLLQMEQLWKEGDYAVEPNNRIFNMVINAYAKSDDFFAARKAFDLLGRMKTSSKCQPDIISYTSVMECLSKSADPKAVQQAEELLDEAFRRYEETKDPALMPNLRTFTMAILTLAKNHGSVVKARALLTQCMDLYIETKNPLLLPNEYPYNYVLNCAANTLENQQEAFKIATQTYQEMRQSKTVNPDSFTYAFWLKCCNNLLPESDLRTKCVSYAFEECKKEGLVSKEVLTRLFQGNRPTVVNLLLENQTNRQPYRNVKVQDLPPAWSRRTARRGNR
jgi:pentatricopeptide repeat protein